MADATFITSGVWNVSVIRIETEICLKYIEA